MPVMTGPRSPSSSWPQGSPNVQLTGSPSFFPRNETQPLPFQPNASPHNTASDQSGPGYFPVGVESAFHSRKLSPTGPSQVPSPKSQYGVSKQMVEDSENVQRNNSRPQGRKDSSTHRLSLNNTPSKESKYDTGGAFATQITVGPISVERCAELLELSPDNVMLLDVRPFTHFAKGNIKGSFNLCIPTTLLKRPSFNTQKLANTFTSDVDKQRFTKWKNCPCIIVYDAGTSDMKDAGPLANVLKKFVVEGWAGRGLILLGGFNAFSSRFSTLVQQQQLPASSQSSKKPTAMHINLPHSAPVAGGCALPESASATIPFFSNIRQNMDLVGGVGQIPPKIPESLTKSKLRSLPSWLKGASDVSDKGRAISEKFFKLEKDELERMKQALSYEKESESNLASAGKFRIAGIEKGAKNRYNDIYPFDHSRVKLQNVSPGGCDYVNANYLKATYSDKLYIATQAPVPDTFNDFWRVVWEQDVRLIVSLTAEVERGQVKCHSYWESGRYGPFKVDNFARRQISMNSPGTHEADSGQNTSSPTTNEDSGNPTIIKRHFGLSHSALPFQPLREVTQLQYPCWPDFGTTSQPSHLLKLIEECDKVIGKTGYAKQRPIVVHCSAGCGRTGTFCTVDSVLGMLRQQILQQEADTFSDREDLVERTVADFRTQRPSMIQNISQFVLCYESLLEWASLQLTDDGVLKESR